MKLEPAIRNRIIRNVLLSIVIYSLPVLLMFLTFHVSGQRPWEKRLKEKKQAAVTKITSPNSNR